ncbi:Calcium/calmodulin-dependent protein kinase protein [Dioscorea alata]|uniref:Calcium/calmodulin-dependent protein kinase protein n=1 Tax=Dioscorea alata TaxID=55571 RepID=A0ACB7VRW8_DIOAL|nr:Calcium/calmodulin-dependent protein kinase protein [Dioscorea alata]
MQLNKPSLHDKKKKKKKEVNSVVRKRSKSSNEEEPLQVTFNIPTVYNKIRITRDMNNLNSSKSSTKTLVKTSSLKQVLVPNVRESSESELHSKRHVRKRTCSSTQKESSFPQALKLEPGGTEAEGVSSLKVCSYRYCSLNSHRYEALPPLKSFLSTRRQSLKTEKKMKGLLAEQGDEEKTVLRSADFLAEIHGAYEEKINEKEGSCDSTSEGGEDEEMDVMIDVLEYVGCDQSVKEDEEEKQQSLFSECSTENQMNCCIYEATNYISDGAKDTDGTIEVMQEHSSLDIDNNTLKMTCVREGGRDACDLPLSCKEGAVGLSKDQGSDNINNFTHLCSENSEGYLDLPVLYNKYIDEENKEKTETEIQDQHSTESCSNSKARITIIRKKRNEEVEITREFNPRPPNFRPIEPAQATERVSLQHQIINERKNAEEWMIDYALQQAVSKLSLTGKRKVALLVEAFETVMPLCMQACS